jgi:uncharacterized damage-inducible protein DinB
MLEQLKRLFAHMRWADLRALDSLRSTKTPPETLALYAHIVGTEHVWLSRLRGVPPELVVWPALTLEQCAAQAESNAAVFERCLAELTEPALALEVAYTNSAGQSFHSRVDDILLQVVTHGSYHRGQIASQVRKAGGTPAATDYIGFVRGVPAATRVHTN